MRKSHTTITRHQEDKQSKTTSSLFPIEMIAKLKKDTKQRTTKHITIAESHNGSNNQQRINNNRTTTLERTAAKAWGDLNAFYWYKMFALDSAVVEVQKMFSSHGGKVATKSLIGHRSKSVAASLLSMHKRLAGTDSNRQLAAKVF